MLCCWTWILNKFKKAHPEFNPHPTSQDNLGLSDSTHGGSDLREQSLSFDNIFQFPLIFSWHLQRSRLVGQHQFSPHFLDTLFGDRLMALVPVHVSQRPMLYKKGNLDQSWFEDHLLHHYFRWSHTTSGSRSVFLSDLTLDLLDQFIYSV